MAHPPLVDQLLNLSARLLAPYSPRDQNLSAVEKAPSLAHIMGTDGLGRDIFSRMIYGARTSLIVVIVVISSTVVIGLTAGSAAAFFGGWVDTLVMRTVDVLFAFPSLLFALFISATVKQGVLEWLKQNGMTEAARSGIVDYVVVFATHCWFAMAVIHIVVVIVYHLTTISEEWSVSFNDDR